MVFIPREEPFDCENCGEHVQPLEHGTYRNHCPHCLCSKHIDEEGPGDRSSVCGGIMVPVALETKRDMFTLVHRCASCGKEVRNITALDDDVDRIIEVSSSHF